MVVREDERAENSDGRFQEMVDAITGAFEGAEKKARSDQTPLVGFGETRPSSPEVVVKGR